MTKIKKAVAILAAVSLGAISTAAFADPDQGSIARGGKLYDKWYKVIKADTPTETHPLYPSSNEKYAKQPNNNWRCKECHGWDGRGVDGAYKSGSHATGIKGVNGMAGGDPAAVIAVLKSKQHGFSDKLSDEDMTDLANFVVYGLPDWAKYVGDDKSVKGDAAQGKQVYGTICANCHGADGKEPKGMPPLGSLMGNPWEIMHKVLNGQPAETMPALRALDHQVSADVLAYLKTLPQE